MSDSRLGLSVGWPVGVGFQLPKRGGAGCWPRGERGLGLLVNPRLRQEEFVFVFSIWFVRKSLFLYLVAGAFLAGQESVRLQDDSLKSPEQLRQEIERCKELYSVLEKDCAKLQMAKEAAQQRTQGLKKEGELHKILEQQLPLNGDEERAHQISAIKEENNRLRQEKHALKNKLEELKKKVLWNDPVMILSALPEKKMIFKGLTANKEDMNKLMLTPLIHCPLPGGSALITFEEAEVAQRIIEMREHTVELSCGELEELDQCRVRVRAVPMDILLPSALEIRLSQNSRSILVSDLPSLDISKEALLDKLELFFSKTKNGGSEVESREFLEDSHQVVLTFTQDGVAEPLVERGHTQVPIGKAKYKIKISPCMSGDISNVQLQPSRCPRTVLLLGIPDVLSVESMRDALEIHFQKASRGGGEVDALAYVPAGRTGVAVFVEDTG
ncbi:interferon-induced 35 kDa protein isoform X2 [Onychostruthus taczanowskii]|uniref:interferon-induced 35 kDa protein isoform X2 n=1 Tax=Onychostruthus taczanowskii TaxID=356909 RepID=UPI001B803AF9|nr:interferon-induced 35 kDa protein isoform X2 [Onychostruthus taczanowskii]